jgi:short-subunit dehydrogenase
MEASGKYALITGASSGIGWHISEELAERGYSIIAVSNQPVQLQDLKTKLELTFKIRVITFDIDLTQEDSAQQVFDFCEKNNLSVEVLINDAGIFVFGEIVNVDYSRIKSILALHTATPTLLCRLFGKQMISQKKGFILNVSSITAVMPYPTISLYGPTKKYLRHFTRAFRTEMKAYGINVTCLIPGATDTALYDASNFRTPLLMKLGLMKKPQSVAKAGIKALFNNRAECIPGFLNKLTVVLLPLVPHFVIRLIYLHTNIVRKSQTNST